jgi:hypothetical protein
MVDYGNWDGEFVLGGWILASVHLDLSLDREPVLASEDAVGGIWESIQFLKCLADGTKRNLNGATSSADFMAVPVLSCLDPVKRNREGG